MNTLIHNNTLRRILLSAALSAALFTSGSLMAEDYAIDKKGQHASIQFKISHLVTVG